MERREILVLGHDDRRAGFLRFGHFWDEIPFMNLLWVQEGSRGRGLGTRLVSFWEDEMRESGHEMVMTSTLSNERAQHLYRRLGYRDCGSLLMPDLQGISGVGLQKETSAGTTPIWHSQPS